jgi:ATP-dependent RNA helicase RhlE
MRTLVILVSCIGFSQAFVPSAASHRRRSSCFSAEQESQEDELSFEDLGLCQEALSAVRSQPEWKRPTPIQQLVIPKLLQLQKQKQQSLEENFYSQGDGNEDDITVDSVWCESPTGSGKTAAYALPLLQNLMKLKKNGRIASLVLCPTRELAAQIGQVTTNLALNMSTLKRGNKQKWNIMTMYGGIPLEPQISQLADYNRNKETLDVLIATPGRLVDVLTYYADESGDSSAKDAALERRLLKAMDQSGKEDTSLSIEDIDSLKLDRDDDDGRRSLVNLLTDLEFFVLDEADRLLGRGFESEIDSVLELLPERVQTWLFSATYPKQIEPRVDQVLKRIGSTSPIRISCANSDRVVEQEVSSSLQRKLERTTVAPQVQKVGPASTIQLRAIRLEKPARTQALRFLLKENEDWDRVLVFVATRYAAGHVSQKLRRAGILSAELHGKLDQDARSRRLNDLKKGKIRVLVATDVASRGLDIVGLPVMVNYDLPRSTTDFVHRVGRTGRAGNTGTAITFVTPSSESQLDLIEKRHLTESIEREILPGFEPNEERWQVEAEATRISAPGTTHSDKGLAHDRMFGGLKGHRKSKKDKLRVQAVLDHTGDQEEVEAIS